jgi:hypothetical protein
MPWRQKRNTIRRPYIECPMQRQESGARAKKNGGQCIWLRPLFYRSPLRNIVYWISRLCTNFDDQSHRGTTGHRRSWIRSIHDKAYSVIQRVGILCWDTGTLARSKKDDFHCGPLLEWVRSPTGMNGHSFWAFMRENRFISMGCIRLLK